MDIKKVLKLALVPTLVLIILAILILAMELTLNFLGVLLGVALVPLQVLALMYIGYDAIQNRKLQLSDAAAAGAIASFISCGVWFVIWLLFAVLGLQLTGVIGVLGFTLDLVLGAVIGFVSIGLSAIVGAGIASLGAVISRKL